MSSTTNSFSFKKAGFSSFLAFFLFFMFASYVDAAQPSIITTSPPNGLIVDSLIFDTIKQNTGFTFHTHVYNVSNGLNVSNISTTCYIHLYNSTGNHLLRANMTYDGKGDFEAVIGASNFSNVGKYALEVWCVSGLIGGSERIFFDVTENSSINNKLFIIFGVLAIVLLFLGIYVEDLWVTAFGGLIFTGLGLYMLINGIDTFKNTTTNMISILVTFFGIYVMVKSSLDQIK